MRFLVLAALVACSSGKPASGPEPEPEPVQQLLSDADQLVLGIAADFDATDVTLTRFEKKDGAWVTVGAPIPAVLGRAGQGWGRGLHGAGAPPGRPGPTKVEGDGKAPSGAFTIVRAFGYAERATSALPYQPLDDSWRCVDDPASAHYNDVLDADGVTVDWTSAETMRRDDELYRWVVELDHNAATGDAHPGGGSCIFFHVWAGPDDTTAGCTAMAEPALADLLAWLRPGAVYVLLPRAERDALAAAWGLP